MKLKKMWFIQPVYIIMIFFIIAYLVAVYLYNITAFYISVPACVIALVYVLYKLVNLRKDIHRFWISASEQFNMGHLQSMFDVPMPVLVLNNQSMEIVWYNTIFSKICTKENIYGLNFSNITQKTTEMLFANQGQMISYNDKYYKIYILSATEEASNLNMVYLIEVTELQKIYEEYHLSRPVIMIIAIDSYEEISKNSKESEKTQILTETYKILEDFISAGQGFVKRLNRDKYFAIVEYHYFEKLRNEKFKILDQVKTVTNNEGVPVTLSIGIGFEEETLEKSEHSSYQALEMALGRGGDQVVVKTVNGYDFYGGSSQGIEKRNKVKSRIVASALSDAILSAGNILIMGHKFSDLDSVGAAIGLSSACKAMNKPVHIVIDRDKTLSKPLIDYFIQYEGSDIFIPPIEAIAYVRRDTLLIIVDTHSPHFIESVDVYKSCKNVVLIDHHRRMVEYIDNTIISLHEPYASSTSEMVTELLQYFKDENCLKHYHAEALMAGIMLDTKNFIMKAGVRTFEAAAHLKRVGADNVQVRRLFSSSMMIYQEKTKLVSSADIYKRCAVAISDLSVSDVRIIAPQAADELLGIENVDASFVMYELNDCINISARSMGGLNVQVVMEKLGGGGHQTMAAAQIPNSNYDKVKQLLLESIDEYYNEKYNGNI